LLIDAQLDNVTFMARPKRKGDLIQFRLRLEDDEIIRSMAAAKGMKVGEYVADYLSRAAQVIVEKRRNESAKENR
jgi:uncharacterized protein (DUF1778 family)